jgi:hypothetical protein
MKPKIFHGKIDGSHFVISIFSEKEIILPLKKGLQKFFEKYESSKLDEKRKKESDQGHISLSGSSSGCKR